MLTALFAGKRRAPLLIVSTLLLLLAGGLAAVLITQKARPTGQVLQLADGIEAFFYSDSKFTPAAGYPHPRQIAVDGEFFLRIPDRPHELTLRTRLLVLTVRGPTALRIVAYAREAGEQVEVLYGEVVARKSYESPYSEPDHLGPGGMVLINRDIDLMEKEKCDQEELRAWSERFMQATAAAGRKPRER
jgi:hypothetical protein